MSAQNPTRERTAAAIAGLLGALALWRLGLAAWHYRASIAPGLDASTRDREQTIALLEAGLALLLAAHALAAAYFKRREVRLHGGLILGLGTLTAILIGGSLAGIPILGMRMLLPISLTIVCMGAGYLLDSPWASTYLGTLIGGIVGYAAGQGAIDSFGQIMNALLIILPAVIVAFMGTGLGRILRRIAPLPETRD